MLTQATRSDVAKSVSTPLAVDLAKFVLAAAPTSFSDSKGAINTGTAQAEQQTGTRKSTFSMDEKYGTVFYPGTLLTLKIRKIFIVAAYDIEVLSVSVQKRQGLPLTGSPLILPGGPLVVTSEPTAQTRNPDTSTDTNNPPPPPTTSITPTTSTATMTRSGQDDPYLSPSSTSSSTSALVSGPTTGSTPSTPNTSANSGENTKGDSRTPQANALASSSGQTNETNGQHGTPNTQNTHQRGNPTSTSAAPSAALPSGTPPVTGKPNIGTIIGAVLGALLLLILILVVILCYRRRRKHRQDKWWKPAGGRITFFNDKMVNRPDEESEKGKAHGDNRGLFGHSIFASKTAHQRETDGMSSVDSFASDLPLSTAYTSTISEYESDSTSTFTMGLSEASTDVKGDGHGTGARTERQMEIEGKIFELQREIIGLRAAGANATDVMQLRERIERLRNIQGEKWAMEVTDEVPSEMAH
ncbi:hypothetical protein PM082_009690 [Marasmius tenuissimus]|nr:hypothetical protein PM082_009690 [Marasmius tenuissimus]